jgi:hypothetical protein
MNTLTQFEAGKTYFGRSICDHECVYRMTVLRRTAKTVTVQMSNREAPKTLRPRLYGNVETVRPNGTYSMALTISADREVAS